MRLGKKSGMNGALQILMPREMTFTLSSPNHHTAKAMNSCGNMMRIILSWATATIKWISGLTIKNLNVIGYASDPKYEISVYPNKDKIHNYSLIFYAKKSTRKLTTNDPETLELKWYKINKLPKMIKNHERTIGYFIKYKESGKFYLI